jgi:hypothetical protein
MKPLDFSQFLKDTYAEMAQYNRLPDVATPLDDTFISFIYHVPPEVRRLAEIWFWQKGFWEASHKRDFLAKKQNTKNPEKIEKGITPYYVDFPTKGGVLRVMLKDPKTGQSIVRNWHDPSKTVDLYEDLFKTMQDKIGRKGILGTDPDDPEGTNKPGHDLSGAKTRKQHAAYNQKLGTYTRHGEYPPGHPQAGQPLPAHHPEEEEMVLPNLGLPVIQTTDDKTTAMRAMSTKKLRNELEQSVMDKLQMVGFDPSKLKTYNPETKQIEPAKLGKAEVGGGASKKSFEGIERNFAHAKKMQTFDAPVDWEQMKQNGWRPLYRPTYNEQENSFTAVKWNKGRLEQMNLKADPKTGRYVRTFASEYGIKNMQVDPATGRILKVDYKKDASGKPQKTAKQIPSSMVPIIIPFNKPTSELPSVDKPDEFGGRKDGYKAYGGMYLNKDDSTQMRWPPQVQSALENLWITNPELFGDEKSWSKDGGDVVSSIFKGFKKSDTGASDKDYYDIFKYVSTNMRDPAFWMGREFDEKSPQFQHMKEYVKGLIAYATGKSKTPPQMDGDIETMLKAGSGWREGKAASKTYYANLGNKQKALSTTNAEGEEQSLANLKAVSYNDPSKIAAAKEIGEDPSPEEKSNTISANATDLEKVRRKKLGLDKEMENPDVFAGGEDHEQNRKEDIQQVSHSIEKHLIQKVPALAMAEYQKVLNAKNPNDLFGALDMLKFKIEPYVRLAKSGDREDMASTLSKIANIAQDSFIDKAAKTLPTFEEDDFQSLRASISHNVSEALKEFIDSADDTNGAYWAKISQHPKTKELVNLLNSATKNYVNTRAALAQYKTPQPIQQKPQQPVKTVPMDQPKVIPMNKPQEPGIAKAEHVIRFREWYEKRKKALHD